MKVITRECYLVAGFSFHFSGAFSDWISKELGKRIQPSKAFLQTYSKDFAVGISLGASPEISQPMIEGPKPFRRDKEVIIYITLPHPGGPCPAKPQGYAQAVKQLLESSASGFQRLGLDTTRLVEDTPALIQHFIASPDMIVDGDWAKTDLQEQLKWRQRMQTRPRSASQPSKAKSTPRRIVTAADDPPVRPSARSRKRNRTRQVALPKWRIPKNIAKRVDHEGGMWEDERFDPILLTVMSDTSYQGRDIPLAWQIEFDPFDDRLEVANKKIKAAGIEPDGDGWSEVIRKKFAKRYPRLAKECHCDSESSTCVVWVESEDACRKLIEIVWTLMHPASTASA